MQSPGTQQSARQAGPRLGALARLLVSLVVAAAVGVVVGGSDEASIGMLAGIASMGVVFVVLGVCSLWPMTAEHTRGYARREDFRPLLEESIAVAAAVASLVLTVTALAVGPGDQRKLAATLGLAAVAATWATLHLVYATRYANAYYGDPIGGIDFNTDDPPSYKDFFYFSYNLGMTYQVSDTGVSTTALRALILRHCLLSYVFGTGILAATLNLVAGIVTS